MSRWHGAAGSLLCAIVLGGCGVAGPSGRPDPGAVLRQTVAAMAKVSSADLAITFGPGVSLAGLELVSATAQIDVASGASATQFKVEQGGVLLDVSVVSAHGVTYIRLPFSNFVPLSPAQAAEIPPLTSLLQSSGPLLSILTQGTGARSVGSAEIGGRNCDGVALTLSPAQMASIASSSRAQPATGVELTLWSDRSHHLVRRLVLGGDLLAAGKKVRIEIDATGYNGAVRIATPSPIA